MLLKFLFTSEIICQVSRLLLSLLIPYATFQSIRMPFACDSAGHLFGMNFEVIYSAITLLIEESGFIVI